MEQLGKDKINKLLNLREEIDTMISEHIKECEKETLLESIPTLSFSKIKTIFESVAPSLINSKEGGKLTRKYIKLMKENKSLKHACELHRLTNGSHSYTDSNMLLNEALTIIKKDNKMSNLSESTKKMGELVCECVKFSNMDTETLSELVKKEDVISESVDYLLMNEKTISNIDEYLNNFSIVSNHISENVSKGNEVTDDNINVNEIVNELTENTNALSEMWEKSLLEDVTLMYLSGGQENTLFETYINECMSTIDRILEGDVDVTTISRMTQMKEQLSNKKYVKENFSVDIKNLAELKYTLNESIN